jgi:uncharacterized protein YyaL (SSP411 family)
VRAFGAWENPARTAQTMPMMLVAADFLARPVAHLVIAGRRDAADTRALLAVCDAQFLPNVVVMLADETGKLPFTVAAVMREGRATAYLCEDRACQLPTTDPRQLADQLAARRGSSGCRQ